MKCTYHNNDAMMRPTPMQSTNTTHNKNFKNPIKCSFSAIAKPIEDPVNNKKKQTPVRLIKLICEWFNHFIYLQIIVVRL